jgi:hypothetical protein
LRQNVSVENHTRWKFAHLLAAIGRARQAAFFLQIADALQAAVVDGLLKPGDRLPPQRQLAAQLDVDLTNGVLAQAGTPFLPGLS